VILEFSRLIYTSLEMTSLEEFIEEAHTKSEY
jgi:hypothetical protein